MVEHFKNKTRETARSTNPGSSTPVLYHWANRQGICCRICKCFTQTQFELEKLVPNIHRFPESKDSKDIWNELELIHAFVIKLKPSISKDLVSRKFKYTSLQSLIEAAQRFEDHEYGGPNVTSENLRIWLSESLRIWFLENLTFGLYT